MERTVEYTTDAERKSAILTAQAARETMIHDDFTDSGGILTFDILLDVLPTVDELRQLELTGKLQVPGTLTILELTELLRLERGLPELSS